MLINSKEHTKRSNIALVAIISFLVLAALKFVVESKPELFATKSNGLKNEVEVDAPVIVSSSLYIEDLLVGGKNKISTKDNLSLYLNNELGVPTLMAVYKDSISDLELNSRFLVFLYLEDSRAWRNENQKQDHILLAEEKLIPVEMKIAGNSYYIFKIPVVHPYFTFDNLKEFKFVRHNREVGRFTDLLFKKDSLPEIYAVDNRFERLILKVKSKAFKKIALKRAKALESGVLISEDDDFVKANITSDNIENIAAKIRLKGDWTDHLVHPSKWSYRIISEGEKTLFGMRKFSIQHPKSRHFSWEWLFNKVAKDNDIMGLRYDFLNVEMRITDTDSVIPMGIMALEESFDKILIENNKRREGLILSFDESTIWDDRKQLNDLKLDPEADGNRPELKELPIKLYNENKTLSDPGLRKQFEIARNLLIGLRNGKFKLSEVFDVDKLTLYIALSNLFGGHHGLMAENTKIYYNPVTHKLEPISFDSNSGVRVRSLREYPVGLSDDLFQTKLMENYQKVSSPSFVNGFIKKYAEDLKALSLGLRGEFTTAHMDLDILQHNANLIKNKIHPSTTISASLTSMRNNSMEIEVKNFSEFPIIIDALVLQNGKSLNQAEHPLTIAPRDTVKIDFRLKESFNNAFVSKKNKEGGFRYPKDLAKIRLRHHLVGSELNRRAEIRAFDSSLDSKIIQNLAGTDNTSDFEFIEIDESTGTLSFITGKFQLNKTLFIPSKYKVNIAAGFQLNLTNGASIISYAPLMSLGTRENPVLFFSDDNTGGGIFVSSTTEKSILKHSHFKGLSIPKVGLWELSGSVNFNEAAVDLSYCVFEKNRSEDALNIIRSSFTLDKSTFIDTYSDAFDGDFVEGSISNSTFVNSGNDGIDISGSNLTLTNIVIENPSDKGLSAGEGSTMIGNNIKVNGGEIGIVSKDLSTITLTDVTIENTRLGIACFQKKSEFGPGIVNLKKFRFSGIEVPYLIAENSDLIIDDIVTQDKSKDVISKMYGNEFGKSSR